MSFDADVQLQGDAIREALHRSHEGADALSRTINQLAADSQRVIVVGMGSSLSASHFAVSRITRSRPAELAEAGELLHYGTAGIEPGTLLVLVSQSGRSAETLALARLAQREGNARIVAVTNDPLSPLAVIADFVLPILAGAEAAVATKTFMNTFVAMQALADILANDSEHYIAASIRLGLADVIDDLVSSSEIAELAATRLAACSSLIVVGRGPALGSAEYGALVIAETAATHAEAMPGGTFRHGPIEMLGPDLGLIVLAPQGKTRELGVKLALDACDAGSPTWLIGDTTGISGHPELTLSQLPMLQEEYAPLPLCVPIQQFAASLARLKGREPGDLLSATKVTEVQ